MKANQAQTTSRESPRLIKDSQPLVANRMGLVKEYNLLEKGIVTQEDLDYLMDQPIHEPLNRRALTTEWKILKAREPNLKMVDLMEY